MISDTCSIGLRQTAGRRALHNQASHSPKIGKLNVLCDFHLARSTGQMLLTSKS